MILETPKGMKDFLPEEEILREDIINKLRSIFQLYGFSPMDTPAVEKFEVLSSKYAGGEEILKESFKLTDQGKRDLGLRYDLTVPFARVVGMNPKIKTPFKRYQIGKVWRDGPVGMARYREFMQCDVDVVGPRSMYYDAELLILANRFFKEIGLKAKIRLNNRKILNDIITFSGLKKKDAESVILSLDKLEKFGEKEVRKELDQKGVEEQNIEKLFDCVRMDIQKLKNVIPDSEGIKEVEEVLMICKKSKLDVYFDVSLARGLSYYTGNIFEVFLKDSKITSSICAGGRYDELIGKILGNGDFPAVGISFGLSRIFDAIEKNDKKTVTDIYLIPIGEMDESLKIAEFLRNQGIRTEVDLADRGPSKNLKYANAKGIRYAGFIGEKEVKDGRIKIKDLKKGIEKDLKKEDIVSMILNKGISIS